MLTTLLRPWRERRTWLALVQMATTVLVSIVTFTFAVTLIATSAGLLIVLPLAIPVIWVLFAGSHLLADLERSRLAALAGVQLADPVAPPTAEGPWRWLRRLVEQARSGARWKEIAYHLLLLPVGVLLWVVMVTVWAGAATLVVLPPIVAHLPGESAKFGPIELTLGPSVGLAWLLGVVVLLVVAPHLTRLQADLHVRMATALLGPDRSTELGAQVTRLESSRVAAVDTAEAERRRIERDLHDGAQQRLVALAVQLGAAQERLEHDPEGGREMVADAHREAKAALAEIRDLVRGIHPVILEDRGLDAALSAVVARSPVPVDLRVEVPVRPPAAVESAAYFIVNEALTNVAHHAGATRASVTIVRSGDTLVVEVTDDGVGGADPTGGTGLAGLQQRVAGLSGRMHVISPDGGPTSLIVELPCRS